MENLELSNQDYSNFQLFGVGKPSEKQIKRREKRKADIKNLKDGNWKEISAKWNKFNPASTVPRAAGLALVRLNFLGIARKLHAGILNDVELKSKHYNIANAHIVRKLWETTIKDNWEALGGDISSLKEAVKRGFNKPVFKTKKIKKAQKAEKGQSFDGEESEIQYLSPFNRWANELDLSIADNKFNNLFVKEYHNEVDPVTIGALISAGGGIVVAVVNSLAKKGGAKDNPYDPNSSEYKSAENDAPPVAPPLTEQDEADLRAIAIVALEDRKKNGLDSGTYEAEMDAINDKYNDEIWGIKKPYFYGGVAIVSVGVLFGVYKLYKHYKNK